MKKLLFLILIPVLFIASCILGYKYSNSRRANEEESSYSTIANSNSTTEDINLIKAKDLLSTMTLEEKVGQMFLIRCNRYTALEDIDNYKVSGFILFDENIKGETKESLSDTIKSYQDNSSINMIIALDEEGGIVNRLSWYSEFRDFPFSSPQELFNEG